MVTEEPEFSTGYFENGRMKARSVRPRRTVAQHGYLTPVVE
jgi:hypothetical protein